MRRPLTLWQRLSSAPRPRRVTHRPGFDVLEDRCVPAAISGQLFEDLDGNGARDPGDPNLLLAGVTLYLDQNQNGARDAGEATALTDASGAYTFPGLAAGTYTVAQEGPAGWIQTSPAPSPGSGLQGGVVQEFAAPESRPVGLAWANGFLYVVDGTPDSVIAQVDPATGTLTGQQISLTAPYGVYFITFDGTQFWGSDLANDRIFRFSTSGTVLQSFVSPVADPGGLVWDGDSLLVTDHTTGRIYDLNPTDGSVQNSFAAPEPGVWGLAFDGNSLWVGGDTNNRVYQIDASTGQVLRSFDAPGSEQGSRPAGLTIDGQSLWLAQYEAGHIFRLDIPPAGTQAVALADGQTVGGIDFGDFRLGSASGRVFQDLNSNGTEDTGETGLEGWRIYIDQNGNGQYDVWEKSALTDAAGDYSIGGLTSGTCTVAQVLRQPGWTQTAPAGLTYSVTIASSGQAVVGNNFGNQLNGFGPVGPELRVNTTVAGTQAPTNPSGDQYQMVNSVATDGQGNTVVVWQGNGPGDADGIFSQRYDANGAPVGGETRVNVTTGGVQSNPLVARAATNGQYVVAWTSGSTSWARLYNAAGTPLTGEFQVGGTPSFAHSLAMDASGDFVLLYRTPTYKGGFNHYTWYVQRYNAAGTAQGRAISVASPRLVSGAGSVAMNAAGDFVVVWDEVDNGLFIYAQRYRADGRAVGSRIQVNPNPAAGHLQWCSNVAMDAAGNFVVTWQQKKSPQNPNNGWGQRFNADGTRSGPTFQFAADSGQTRTAMALQSNGDVVLAWQSAEVYLQVFSAAGVPRANPAVVNTTLANSQSMPSVAVDGSGRVTVVWGGNGIGDDAGVFGQRYASTSPLLAAASTASPNAGTQTLTAAELSTIRQEALLRWERTGLSAEQVAALQSADVRIADLGGAYLGLQSGTTVWIDDNAAGYGWFLDTTPSDDSEFSSPGDQGEQGKMDLLTTLMHEFGHVLGLPDLYDVTDAGQLMYGFLSTGERRTAVGQGTSPILAPTLGSDASVDAIRSELHRPDPGTAERASASSDDVAGLDWYAIAVALTLDHQAKRR